MIKPYLIQRMQFKSTPSGKTIDGILSMDYMGSAEFEFGALPKSLNKMIAVVDKLTIECFTHIKNYKNQTLCLIGLTDDIYDYISYIDDIVKDKLLLKERTNIRNNITGKDFLGRPINDQFFSFTNAWWDIENQIMFTFGEGNAIKIVKAIKATRDRKKSEDS